MPALYPSADELKQYLTGGKVHSMHKAQVDLAFSMKMHMNKLYPEKLIKERRPSESEDVHKFRNSIYKSKTSSPLKKVVASLGKIRRSKDWMIKFPENRNSSILESETLESYCTSNLPIHGSITQWAFIDLINAQATDVNSWIAVLPQYFVIEKNEYFKPVPTIYSSKQVMHPPDKGDYCFLRSTEKVDIMDDKGNITYNTGMVYYMLNTEVVIRYEQMNAGLDFRSIEYAHPFKEIPAYKLRGMIEELEDGSLVQVSRLDPMVSHLDEAAREYNDVQSVKVQNAHPLFWYIDNRECDSCRGLGKVVSEIITDDNGNSLERPCAPRACRKCIGTGKLRFSPFVSMAIKPASVGEQNAPMPPAGYISRDVEVMKYLDESVEKHIYDALSAVNMQFLDQTPLSISGDAKQVDREELNNFVYSFAEDLVWAIDRAIFWICEWRYYIRVPDASKRKEMLPEIPVPENFDLLPSEYLVDEISKAKTSKVNPVLVAALEKDFASKKFYNKPDVAEMLDAVYELNPLPGLSDEEKMIRLSNKGITQEDYVISSNIEQFVKRALKEEKAFLKMDWSKQMELMAKYAKTKITENSAKEAILTAMNPDPNNVPGGEKNADPAQQGEGQAAQSGNQEAA